jgi:small subunit ribosomal protein S21
MTTFQSIQHLGLKPHNMLIINIKDHRSLDRALKTLKRKFEQAGTVRELRVRKEFIKPSVKCRDEVLDAKYRQTFVTND